MKKLFIILALLPLFILICSLGATKKNPPIQNDVLLLSKTKKPKSLSNTSTTKTGSKTSIVSILITEQKQPNFSPGPMNHEIIKLMADNYNRSQIGESSSVNESPLSISTVKTEEIAVITIGFANTSEKTLVTKQAKQIDQDYTQELEDSFCFIS